MGDSWEDEDDWEVEADRLVAGVNLHEVDESKFAGEADAPVEDDWENDVPASQPKKVVVSKYADKDRAAKAAAARNAAFDPNDKAAAMRAQAEGEMEMIADMIGGEGGQNEIDLMEQPSTNAEFEVYARAIVERYGTPHKGSKQFKYFVKQMCKLLCEHLDKDGVKDIESAVGAVRSDKVKKEREQAAKDKKGPKRSLKMESNDLTAGLDDLKFSNYGDADDDGDFM